MPDRVYLDWNATTPLRPEAREAMAAAWDLPGNPSSVHEEGRKARRLVEDARAAVAGAVGALPRNVVFTSGGTEANALALTPGLRLRSGLRSSGWWFRPSSTPRCSRADGLRPMRSSRSVYPAPAWYVLDRLREALAGGPPALVSVMLANNETGAMQPIAEVAEIVHAAGSVLHVDAIQAFGKIPFNINMLNADLVTLSAHKIGGPKGVGALVWAEGVQGLEPLLRGGGQERGHRAGTENVAGIAGFGAAVKAAMGALENDAIRLETLRNRLENGLRQTPGVLIFSDDAPRLPNTTLFTAPGLKAETAVIGFDLAGIAVSSGSACSSGKVQPSHVLEAMGFGRELAQGAVRLSLGWSSCEADIDRCLEAWRKLAGTLTKGSDETLLERF